MDDVVVVITKGMEAMNTQVWIELLVVVLRIFAAGLAG
jgi:hypothetical protein